MTQWQFFMEFETSNFQLQYLFKTFKLMQTTVTAESTQVYLYLNQYDSLHLSTQFANIIQTKSQHLTLFVAIIRVQSKNFCVKLKLLINCGVCKINNILWFSSFLSAFVKGNIFIRFCILQIA